MPSKNPNEYSDIAAILDAVLPRGGGTYKLPSYGSAVRWAQRAYNLRKALRETQLPTLLPGQAPFTKYDDMVLQVEKKRTPKGIKDDKGPAMVTISFKRMHGELRDNAGNPIEPLGLRSVTKTPSEDEIDDMLKGLE